MSHTNGGCHEDQTDIIKALAKMGKTNGTTNPDSKHNTGNLLGEALCGVGSRRMQEPSRGCREGYGERGSDP